MKKSLLFSLLFLLFATKIMSISTLDNKPQTGGKRVKDFYCLTIPKSGTHLLMKLLFMLTEKNPNNLTSFNLINADYNKFENILLGIKKENRFPICHGYYAHENFKKFRNKHPNYIQLLMIRDLRAILVSLVFHFKKSIEQEMGCAATVGKQLTHVMDLPKSKVGLMLKSCIKQMIERKKSLKKNGMLLRFEDLIGPMGGGSKNLQKKTIMKIADRLGVELSQDKLNSLCSELFGEGPYAVTFRRGKIDSWKNHFTPEHHRLFFQKWGKYQRKLGYPLRKI